MVTLIFFHTIADPNWIFFRHFSQFCEEEEEEQKDNDDPNCAVLGEKQFALSIQAWKNVPFHILRCLFLKDIISTGICFAMDRLMAFYFERVAVKLFRAASGFLFYIAIKNRQKSHFALLDALTSCRMALWNSVVLPKIRCWSLNFVTFDNFPPVFQERNFDTVDEIICKKSLRNANLIFKCLAHFARDILVQLSTDKLISNSSKTNQTFKSWRLMQFSSSLV